MGDNLPDKKAESMAIVGGAAGAGALIGSCIPVVGTAIGCGIGAILGGAAVIVKELKDDD